MAVFLKRGKYTYTNFCINRLQGVFVMFKSFMILYVFYGFISLQASEKSSLRSFADNLTQYLSPKPSGYSALPTEDSSSRVFPLTPAEIEDRRRQ